MNSSVESYIASKKEWAEALNLLREIFSAVELKETVKWGIPSYTLNNKNVVSFSAFKSYIGIWFFNGVFLKDAAHKLLNAQEGVTRGQRQWRFQSLEEAKREETRHRRLEKICPMILQGVGLNDKYKK